MNDFRWTSGTCVGAPISEKNLLLGLKVLDGNSAAVNVGLTELGPGPLVELKVSSAEPPTASG